MPRTIRDVIHKGTGRDASSSPSSSSSVCTAVSPRNTCRCFAFFFCFFFGLLLLLLFPLKRANIGPSDSQSKQKRMVLTDAFRGEGTAERRAVRGGPALIAISAPLPDYRLQPSPTIGGRGHRRPLADSSDHRGRDKNLIHLPPQLKIPACPGDLSFLINSVRRRIINVTVIYARSSNRSAFWNFIGILSAVPINSVCAGASITAPWSSATFNAKKKKNIH